MRVNDFKIKEMGKECFNIIMERNIVVNGGQENVTEWENICMQIKIDIKVDE